MTRLLSDRGELSLDGRALLYWVRLSPTERARRHPPVAAMRRFLNMWEGTKKPPVLHPAIESRRCDLVSECQRVVLAADIERGD